MRPIVLASALLLVLSGCAASEPEVNPEAQATQTAEATETQTNETQATEAQGTQEPAEVSAEQVEEPQEPQSVDQDSNEPDAVESESQESEESESETSAQAQSSATTEPSPTQEPEPTQEPTEQATEEPASEPEIVGYTLSEVAQRNTASDCWVAIDGGVFDLTMWISRHPGGAVAITQLCGTDGTQQFLGMHGGQSRPSSTLDGYYIGPLR